METEKENNTEMSYIYEADKKDQYGKTKKLRFNREKRNTLYTELVDEYVKDKEKYNKQQSWMKKAFFWFTCISFMLIVLVSLITVILIACKETKNVYDLAVALVGLANILGVIVLLPSKIADHLFPNSANKELTELITSMQRFDLKLEDEAPDETYFKSTKESND